MPTPRPFVVDPTFTALAIGFRNPAASLIADQVLPRVTVGGERFEWLEYAAQDAYTVPPTAVGRKGRVNQVEFGATVRTDSVDDFGLEDAIPLSDINSARQQREAGLSSYNPEARAVEVLTDLVLLDREIRVANRVFDANTYDATRRVALSGTSQFSDYVNSDPIVVIQTGMDATLGVRPNTMVFGQRTWTRFRSNPKIVNAVKGNNTGNGMVSRQEVAELFEVDQVLVGSGFVNTARKGQAVNMQRVWGNHLALLHLNPLAANQTGLTFGYTGEYLSRRVWRREDAEVGLEGGTVIRVGERIKEVISAPATSYFIQNAVA